MISVYKYRGVRLDPDQSESRLTIVRAEIDLVWTIEDIESLASWAKSPANSPESRRLAGQKALRALDATGEHRQRKPTGLTAAAIMAMTAGLTREWMSPSHWCSDLDDEALAVKR